MFVSPVPMTGISSLRASVTAIRSRCGSMTHIPPGSRPPARLERLERAETLSDGHEVGEEATEPALVDVGHARPRSLFGDRLLRLFLGAGEEPGLAARGGLAPHGAGPG